MTREDEQRAAVVAEARTWIRTPYHPAGRMKHVGCDCLTFPAEVYEAAGVIPRQEPGYYPPDWHLHRSDERYLAGVLKIASEVPAPRSGDFVLWRIGRALAHGAIVVAWPRIIHAVQGVGVIEDPEIPSSLIYDRRQGAREHRFFSPWAKGGPR